MFPSTMGLRQTVHDFYCIKSIYLDQIASFEHRMRRIEERKAPQFLNYVGDAVTRKAKEESKLSGDNDVALCEMRNVT